MKSELGNSKMKNKEYAVRSKFLKNSKEKLNHELEKRDEMIRDEIVI